MAFTKLYVTRASTHTPINGITRKGTVDAEPVSILDKFLPTKRDENSLVDYTRSETSTTDGWRVCCFRGVTPPLSAQTISGTVDVIIQTFENNADANLHWWLHIWVTQGDANTVRATLLDNYTEALGVNEWPTTRTAIALAAAQALTSSAIQAGDRIVVEGGYVARNTTASSRSGAPRLGTGSFIGSAPNADATLGSAATNVVGFLEFSNSITTPAAPANDECASATVINPASLPYSNVLNVEWASENASDPQVTYTAWYLYNTIWYSFTPTATGRYVVDCVGSDCAPIFGVFSGTCGSLTELNSSEDPFGVDLTASTTYYIMVGTLDGGGGNVTLNVRAGSPGSGPVLTAAPPNSRLSFLSWTSGLTPYELQRCTGSGCSTWATISNNIFTTTYNDGTLTAGTTYRYRVRNNSALEGPGPWSNEVEITTPAGSVGVTQYRGAVKMIGGFMRADANSSTHRILEIAGVLMFDMRFTGGGGSCGGFAQFGKLASVYSTPSGAVNPDGGGTTGDFTLTTPSAPVTSIPGEWNDPTDVPNSPKNCSTGHVIEVKFRFGSSDVFAPNDSRAADGYYEIAVNGAVIKRVDNIALGNTTVATPGWKIVRIGPAGMDDTNADGMNGGLTYLYVSGDDRFDDASPLYEQDMAGATDAGVFSFWGRDNADGSLFGTGTSPVLVTGKQSVKAVVANISEMFYNNMAPPQFPLEGPYEPPPSPEPPPVPPGVNTSEDCPCEPGTGPVLEPTPYEPIPDWVATCGFGGLAPDGTVPTYSENWLLQ